MRGSRLTTALILAVVGIIWIGQGMDVIGGSAMSGSSFWAVIGTGLVLAAIALVLRERRHARIQRG